MDILTETKNKINNDFINLYKNKIIIAVIMKNVKITKEYLDYCYNNKIFNNSLNIEWGQKFVDIEDFENKTYTFIVIKPIITIDYIIYNVDGGFNRIKSNVIKKYIKNNYNFNKYKKFILIYFHGSCNNISTLNLIKAIIDLISDKIPFVYININYNEDKINDFNMKIELKLKRKQYNNFIYVSSIFSQQKFLVSEYCKNFIPVIFNGKYRKKTIYNRILYYFIMYSIK